MMAIKLYVIDIKMLVSISLELNRYRNFLAKLIQLFPLIQKDIIDFWSWQSAILIVSDILILI